ncbi:MAG: maleylacetoacetate isomerase [Proteobacteria bacterium]|nr:maleylacetoacetate isomerase [Pseudomonadota bacterium]
MTALHQAATSSASWRVRIALALKGIAYETRWLSLERDENLAPGYVELNPVQQVPCLAIDGLMLTQSVAIVEYLDETRPDPPLLPVSAADRAYVRTVVEIVNSGIQPMHNRAVRRALVERYGAEDDARAWSRYWIERRLAALERVVASRAGRYCLGDTVTSADVFVYPQLMTAARFAVDTTPLPVLLGIAERLRMLPAFRDSHPPMGG